MRVVIDTSPLVALDRIGRLDVLRGLYDQIVIPQSVLDELLEAQEHYQVSAGLMAAGWIVTEPDPSELPLRAELGSGEAAAVALALRTGADLLIVDGMRARAAASGMGQPITGTLGVLSAAHLAGMIDDHAKLLQDLRAAGFEMDPELVDETSDVVYG